MDKLKQELKLITASCKAELKTSLVGDSKIEQQLNKWKSSASIVEKLNSDLVDATNEYLKEHKIEDTKQASSLINDEIEDFQLYTKDLG